MRKKTAENKRLNCEQSLLFFPLLIRLLFLLTIKIVVEEKS